MKRGLLARLSLTSVIAFAAACSLSTDDSESFSGGLPSSSSGAATTGTSTTGGTTSDSTTSGGTDTAGTNSTSTTGVDPTTSTSGTTGSTSSTTGTPVNCNNDGVIDAGEECDGADIGGATCAELGFTDGTVQCANCKLSTTMCSKCGDGVKAASEACDGSQFGGVNCVSLGYVGGTVSCAADCQSIDESNCQEPPKCGDGVINGNDQCEGADLGGQTCMSQPNMYTGGTLSCNADCTINKTACTGGCALAGGPFGGGEPCTTADDCCPCNSITGDPPTCEPGPFGGGNACICPPF